MKQSYDLSQEKRGRIATAEIEKKGLSLNKITQKTERRSTHASLEWVRLPTSTI